MPRIRIERPTTFSFATEIPVRITDINYGGHLGNDALLSLLHEARLQFLKHHGFTEADVGGCGMVMVDAAISYREEVFYGDVLRIEVAVTDLRHSGCDFVYRVTKVSTGTTAAEAKTGLAFFDYRERKVVKAPTRFVKSVAEQQPENS